MKPLYTEESGFSQEELFQLRWMKQHGVPPQKQCDEPDPEETPVPHPPDRKHARRPESEVDEEIDLHGDDIQSGMFRVEQLLERASRQKYRRVRIIHGVGGDGAEARSLRLSVRRFLNTSASGWIQGWQYDHPNEGSVVVNFPGNLQDTDVV